MTIVSLHLRRPSWVWLPVVLLWVLGLQVAAAYTPTPGSPLARRSHPRLHITQDSIPMLRNAIATSYASTYQDYVDWAASASASDKTNRLGETGHDPLRALMVHEAFISALGPVPGIRYPVSPADFGRRAISTLLDRLRRGDSLAYAAALVYDWTYPAMSAGERAEIANLMRSRSISHKVFAHSLANPQVQPEQMFSSKYYEGFYAWYLGLALWGDGLVDAEADRAVDTFQDVMLNHGYLEAQNFVAGHDGGWSEWIGYASWHPRTHYLLIDGWRTATGENYLAQDSPVGGNAIRHMAELIHLGIDPHKYFDSHYTYVRMGEAETTDTSLLHRSMREQLYFLPRPLAEAGLLREAGLVRHFIETYEVPWMKREHQYLWGFLGVPRSVAPLSPTQAGVPRSRWFQNLGVFLARTGHGNAADGVFHVSDGHFRFDGHDGPDDYPGFGLVKFGTLVNTRVVAHRGYGNLDQYPGGEKFNIVYFEGGHQRSRRSMHTPSDVRQALSGEGDYDHGGIEQVSGRDGLFHYVRVNRSRQFDAGVRHTRDYVWLPGTQPEVDADFLVVYDRTQAPSKPHWVYHVPWEPEVLGATGSADLTTGSGLSDRVGRAYEGTGLVLKALNGKGGVRDSDGGDASFQGGGSAHGVAFVRTVLPPQARLEVTRVAAFDNDVIKRQHHLAIKSHRWQVAVMPLVEAPSQRFLHVFQAADARRTSAMVATSRVQGSPQMEGVWIEREASDRPNYAVLFHQGEGPRDGVVTYTVSGQGTVRHVIAGLLPETVYEVRDGSGVVLERATEANRVWDYRGVDTNRVTGVLFFESTLGGTETYTLVPRGASAGGPPPVPGDVRDQTAPLPPFGFRLQ